MLTKLKKILCVLILVAGVSTLLAAEVSPEYVEEIGEGFGDKPATTYVEYAEYFSSIVKPGKEKYISKKLLAVFNNPGDEEVFSLFLKKLNKKLDEGKSIDQDKVVHLRKYLELIGKEPDQKIEQQEAFLAEQDKKIKEKEASIAKAEAELKLLKKEKKSLEKEKEYLEERIKYLKQKIKERGGDIEKLKAVFGS